MRVLILGGTLFLGRAVVDHALAHGHEVTLFNRGRTNPGLYPDLEQIVVLTIDPRLVPSAIVYEPPAPGLDVLFGRVADLGVDDPVGGQVLGALGRDPLDGVPGLHDPDRVLEGLEVLLEAVAAGAAGEPAAQVVDVGGRQGGITLLGRQLDDRGGPQSAVEVVVEQGLGRLPNGLEVEVGSHG